jgi:hypothetical protein
MVDNKIKIIRSTKNIFDSAKDTTVNNIIAYAKQGEIQIDQATLTKVVNLVQISLDESFQRSAKVFEKEVGAVLDLEIYGKKN